MDPATTSLVITEQYCEGKNWCEYKDGHPQRDRKITDNTNTEIQKQKETALRSLNQTLMSSRSPTKDIRIAKTWQVVTMTGKNHSNCARLTKLYGGVGISI